MPYCIVLKQPEVTRDAEERDRGRGWGNKLPVDICDDQYSSFGAVPAGATSWVARRLRPTPHGPWAGKPLPQLFFSEPATSGGDHRRRGHQLRSDQRHCL